MSTGAGQQSGSQLELLGVPVSWQVILLSERLLAAPIQEHFLWKSVMVVEAAS
jgi:hypothetical protein